MLTTYNEIKQQILDRWSEFESNQYPADIVNEFAESECPIYTSDIIEEWAQMPNEFNDAWQDGFSVSGDITIVELMSVDLFNYYQHQFQTAYTELAEEAFILCVNCGVGIDTGHPFTRFCGECEASE